MPTNLIRTALALVTAGVLLTGCAPSVAGPTPEPLPPRSPSPTAKPTIAPDVFTIVVIGDTLASEPPANCDDCTGFVGQLATTLKGQLGEKVDVFDHTIEGGGLTEVSLALGRDEDDIEKHLADADIVIVSIGFENGPPWDGEACPNPLGSSPTQRVAAIRSYDDACVLATINIFGERYSDTFDTITELSPDASSRLALTTYNNWFGNPRYADIDATVTARLGAIYDEWNKQQCAAAVSVGFECVDVYHLLNGANGRGAAGALVSEDYTHFSQAGHNAIAALITRAV